MLIREYDLQVCMGNEEYPFCICNAKSKRYKHLDYVDSPTPEELAAPALEIIPQPENREEFYSQLLTGFMDKNEHDVPIGDEIMKAMQGQSESWKVIRCSATSAGIVFVLVNPVIYASGVMIKPGDELYGSYEADLKEGKVWIWLDNSIIGHADLKLKVKRYNKKGKLKTSHKYRIIEWPYRFELTEYYKHFIRISNIERETEGDENNKIHVKEFYD